MEVRSYCVYTIYYVFPESVAKGSRLVFQGSGDQGREEFGGVGGYRRRVPTSNGKCLISDETAILPAKMPAPDPRTSSLFNSCTYFQ